jgi:hypothetical protein
MPHFIITIGDIQVYLGTFIDVLIFVLIIQKRVYRILTVFPIYLYILVPREIATICLSHTRYFYTHWFSYSFYISDAFLNLLRLLIIVEVGIRTLRQYDTIWHFTWRLLAVFGSAILLFGILEALRHLHPTQVLILTVQQYLSITQDIVLIVVLAVGWYYSVGVTPLFRSIVTGISIYAAAQIFTSELGRYIANPTNSIFDFIQRFSFFTMVLIWIWAIWKWPGTTAPARQTISQSQYEGLSPKVHDRLRELNDRLSGMNRKR